MSAQVIRIFDRRRLAVNLGTDEDVQIKDKLRIYTPETEILDPGTGESLGAYRRLKATVYVTEVFDKFCIASPPQVRQQIAIPVSEPVGLTSLFLKPKTESKFVPGELNVDSEDLEPLPTGNAVHVGDIVEREQVAAAEESD